MAKRSRLISKAAVTKMLKNAGAGRVSDSAATTFSSVLEEIASEVAKHAIEIAKHSKRKTVQRDDIQLAAKG